MHEQTIKTTPNNVKTAHVETSRNVITTQETPSNGINIFQLVTELPILQKNIFSEDVQWSGEG